MRFLVFGLLFLTAIYVAESRTLVKRDATQDNLKKGVEQLRKSVKKELDKLKAEGKLALGASLQRAEKIVEGLEDQLEKTNPKTEIGKALLRTIESELKRAEAKVQEEIKKLTSGKYYEEITKDELKNKIKGLENRARTRIAKLVSEGKTADANRISHTLRNLVNIEDELEKVNPNTESGKVIIRSLVPFVNRAEAELAEASFYEETKDDLKTQVDNLKKQAQEAIAKLMAQGKTALAEGIKKLETRLIDLETQLEKLNPQTEVGKAILKGLETLVKNAETKLEEEVKKLSGSFYADVDLISMSKANILKRVGELYDQARAAVESMLKSGKTELISGLQKAITMGETIVEKVNALKPATEQGKVLQKLVVKMFQTGNELLSADVKSAQAGTAIPDNKAKLLKVVGDVLDETKVVSENLAKTDKKTLVAALKKVVEVVKFIETELKAQKPVTPVGKVIQGGVEKFVADIQGLLELEIKVFGGAFYAETKDELKTRVDNLKKQAQDTIAKLKSQGKTDLAEVAKKFETRLVNLETMLEKLNPQTELGKTILTSLENIVKNSEAELEQIKKASGSFYEETKDDLKKLSGSF